MTALVEVEPGARVPATSQALFDALAEDLRAAHGYAQVPVVLSLREGGNLVGGVAASCVFGWLVIEALWIAPEHRGRGHARALVAGAEGEARRRGAGHALVDTFSFQAPGFYRKLGYRDVARLEGFPRGHCRHYLTKGL